MAGRDCSFALAQIQLRRVSSTPLAHSINSASMTYIYRRVVLANGTARLQIDITKSSGLNFDMLLSSEILNLTKPDPAIYHKTIDLLGHRPEECVMVAAHAYDLEAAKKVYVVHVALMRDIVSRF
jgi:HAD superfamily hydrolase (TIGR01493 family)